MSGVQLIIWISIPGWEQHERSDLRVPAIPGGKLKIRQSKYLIGMSSTCPKKNTSQATIDDDDCFDAEEEDQDQD